MDVPRVSKWGMVGLEFGTCCDASNVGFCTCACQIEGLHGDWLVVQNMENVEVMPRVFIPLK